MRKQYHIWVALLGNVDRYCYGDSYHSQSNGCKNMVSPSHGMIVKVVPSITFYFGRKEKKKENLDDKYVMYIVILQMLNLSKLKANGHHTTPPCHTETVSLSEELK